jgi:HAD superfamily hydrolase (TIGR01549 family)
MGKNKRKVVIFDFDGTIADTKSLLFDSINSVGPNFGLRKIRKNEMSTLAAMSGRDILKKYKVSFWKLPFIAWRVKHKMAAQMKKVKIFPGFEDVLKKLKKQKAILGVVSSNSQNNIVALLKHYKLDGYFKFVASVPLYRKKRGLKRILRRYNFKSEEVTYVGDEAEDIKAAKALDLEMVAVSFGFNSKRMLVRVVPAADRIIDHWKDF